MEDSKTPSLVEGLASKVVALMTDKMPQAEVVPFLQAVVDAGAARAMPHPVQRLIRMYTKYGYITEPGGEGV